MEQKKPTKKQIEKKLKEATVFVDKAEKSIYLADIGVGIYISKFQTVLSTNFHRHVWENINSVGYSGVFMYLNSFLDIVLAKLDDIKDKNTKGELYYSFGKLKSCSLSENERMIVSKVEMFIYSVNDGLYSIGSNSDQMGVMLYLDYLYTMSKATLISELPEGDILVNTFVKDLVSRMFTNSLQISFDDSNKDTAEKLKNGIQNIFNNAFNETKKLLADNGGKMLDTIAFPKKEQDEANDLNELAN
jgi:hypothetical protein